ncbi:CopG family transcriptional regulator [Candidatus Bathyarchaeota archaeon]|nr:CopG family transcriptional regulator [Candidatus Bathyarchaeota archaeon]
MGEEKKGRFTTVSIPKPLFERVKKQIEGTGFTSVSSYVTYVLREIIAEKRDGQEEAFTKEDEEAVKRRLRALGYLD